MKAYRSLFVLTLAVCLVLASCGHETAVPPRSTGPHGREIRAVWISYLELSASENERSEQAFRQKAEEMVKQLRNGKMNTVFFHVRPFSDALYRSDVFPASACLSGTDGVDPGYDALSIFCEYAEKAGLSVHAWINPFRIGSASTFDKKAATDPAKRILTDDDAENDSRIAEANGTLYYDPANEENRDLILDGVRELLERYPIDGVHIDDYFYPTTEPFIDKKEYDRYCAQGGTMKLDYWRRAQINELVGRLYTCVKSFGTDKIFSISPAADIDRNTDSLYADVARWAKYEGYCDWLIPQAYVGFAHETLPFCETVDRWTALDRDPHVRLLFGLAAYKCGEADVYAGSGRTEWIERTDMLASQIRYLREQKECDGFAFFSYSYIFNRNLSDHSNSEINSVLSVL